jgi:hypothetical protein
MKTKSMKWPGHVARMARKKNAYSSQVGKPEGKRPLGRPRRVDLISLVQDRAQWRALVNVVINLPVQQNFETFRVVAQLVSP